MNLLPWSTLLLAVCGVLVKGRPSSSLLPTDEVVREQSSTTNNTTSSSKNGTSNESVNQLLNERLSNNNDADHIERNKQYRLDSIRSQVLSIVGDVPPSSANRSLDPGFMTTRNFLEPNPWAAGDVYPEKGQSFYPTCEQPRNIDSEAWTDKLSLNLFFNLSFPSSLEGTSHILAAKLRLYKRSNASQPTEATCSSNKIEDESKIRVSIYWFSKAQKNQLVKKKLLDSKMVPAVVSEWMEFNIKSAAKAWRNKEPNLGISIQVEDDENNILQARDYLVPMDCGSKASFLRPIPGILVRRLKFNENSSKPIFSDVPLFPVIDLHTMDIPDRPKKSPEEIEALLNQRISSESSTMVLTSVAASGHRHRHKH